MFSKFGLVGSLLSSIVFHFDKYSIRFQVNIQVFFLLDHGFQEKIFIKITVCLRTEKVRRINDFILLLFSGFTFKVCVGLSCNAV